MTFKLFDRRTQSRARAALVALCCVFASAGALSAQTFQKPPRAVLDVLGAPVPPVGELSPTREYMLLAQGVRYPPIRELAQPMLRLAGLRINPNTSAPHMSPYYVALSIKRISDGAETKIQLPAGAKIGFPQWSPDGRLFAFTNMTPAGLELWVGETATAKVRRLKGVTVNAAYGTPLRWMPDGRTLLVQLVNAKRGPAPVAASVPVGP